MLRIENIKKPTRKVEKIFIHCTASDNPLHDNIATTKKWHLARKFKDVGYHFQILKNGIIEEGRSLESTPAAQKGYNMATIAIALSGYRIDLFTSKQFVSLNRLADWLDLMYGNQITYHGHCEVTPTKSCPVFDYKDILNLTPCGHRIRQP